MLVLGGLSMSNEIVKYDNQLNAVIFRQFKANEMNLFFSIVSRMRDRNTDEVAFTFDQLKALSKYKPSGNVRFIRDLENTYRKMLTLTYGRRSEHVSQYFVLFTGFEINRDEKRVSVKVNPDMQFMLNNIANWTRFSLEQFNELRSGYSKTMFRLLKQYRTVGHAEFQVEDFRELLDVPVSFKSGDIDKRVLRPIREELSTVFKGFDVKKEKHGLGGKITSYAFSWKAESKDADDFSKGIYQRRYAIDNVEFNSSLSEVEKAREIDRIKGLKQGTTLSRRQMQQTLHIGIL